MNTNSATIIDNGLRCLSNGIGSKNTEIFIATILREKFDYTKWRQSLVDSIEKFEDLDRLVKKSQ